MKIIKSFLFLLLISVSVFSQNVAINADGTLPHASAMLDVKSTSKGLLIPNVALTGTVDATTIATPAMSLLVYNTATVSGLTPGYYYNSGTTSSPVWTRLITDVADGSETKVTAGTNVTMTGTGTSASPYVVNATAANGSETKVTAGTNITVSGAGTTASPYVVNATIAYGDIKQGIQSADHNGWVKLNGRLKSSLTASQQAQATALGIGANLPDASNSFPVQNGATLGSVSGSNTVTITQANLPNVSFTGTTSTDGSHQHGLTGDGTNGAYSGNVQTSDRATNYWGGYTNAAGSHSHTTTVSSGGSGTALNITPKSMSVNMFIYLGL